MSVCGSMNTLYLLAEETEIVRLVGEHIHRILRARLNEKARLLCKERHDERKGTDVRL